ncbi:hypothetical protein GCK32_005903 [Trichostrongylus colubriformis]|uniref:Uncharacterized protein n=1 Tax=Trichostrongylus colubriformis TaxID=6319 RepID=A0AAN8FRB6_TRICO
MELPAKEENADSRSLVSKPKRKQFTTTNIDPSPQPLAKKVKLKKKIRAKKQSEVNPLECLKHGVAERQHQDSPEIMELPVKDENADSRSQASKPKRKQFTTATIDPSPQPLAKKVKLKKKIKAKKQSETVTLMEGEATVEEILSTFCPE